MPTKLLLLLSLASVSIKHVFSQAPAIEWQKCYGGPGNEGATCISATSDGGSISCGESNQTAVGGDVTVVYGTSDVWVIKISVNGTLMWEKSFAANEANCVRQTADGGYIMAGSKDTVLNGITSSDYWIVKLDSQGNFLWQKTFGGTKTDIARNIYQTTDGGYIVGGETLSSDGNISGYHGNTDGWVIKLDNFGNLLWQHSLGGSNLDVVTDIKQTSDGGYIASGGTSSFDGDVSNPLHFPFKSS